MDEALATMWTKYRPLILAWLGTAIRALIVAVGVWLKATGKFPGISDRAIGAAADLAPQLAGDVIILLGVGWGALQKWRADREKKTARVMPPHSTEADLDLVMKTTQPGLIPTGPIPTPAEAATIVADAPK